jgi:hypothetical protein
MILLLCLTFIPSLGCGKAYQSITADNLGMQLNGYEGQRISIVGIPETPQRHDFLPPTPLRDGQWTLIVNSVRCTETINFENEPRLRSMLQIAAAARRANRPIKVSGVVKAGQLEMEYFEWIRTDTAWYKNKNPYYSYGEYYEWYPFAYRPNSRVLRALGPR